MGGGEFDELEPEWWRLSDAELMSSLAEIERRRRRLESRALAVLAEVDSRGVASYSGYASLALWQRDVLAISHAEASRRVQLARARAWCPRTAAALAEGTVSQGHLDEIERFRASLSDAVQPDERAAAEPVLAELSTTCDPRAVRRFADRELRLRIDPNGALPSEKSSRSRATSCPCASHRTGGWSCAARWNPNPARCSPPSSAR